MKKLKNLVLAGLMLVSAFATAQWKAGTFDNTSRKYGYVIGEVLQGGQSRALLSVAVSNDNHLMIQVYKLSNISGTHANVDIIFNGDKSTLTEFEGLVDDTDGDTVWLHGKSTLGQIKKYYDDNDKRIILSLANRFKTARFIHIRITEKNGSVNVFKFNMTNSSNVISQVINSQSKNPFGNTGTNNNPFGNNNGNNTRNPFQR